jgi:hypothetical protein
MHGVQARRESNVSEAIYHDLADVWRGVQQMKYRLQIGAQRAKHLEEEHARAAESMSQEMAAIARALFSKCLKALSFHLLSKSS